VLRISWRLDAAERVPPGNLLSGLRPRTSIAKRYKAMTSHLLRCVRLPRDRRYGWHL